MSNIDFGFRMLSDALSNLQQSRYRSALGTGLSPMGQDQSQGQGQGQGQSPDTISPASTASMVAKGRDWAPRLVPIAQKYGVPPDVLMAVAAQESGFNPRARGPTGDYGMFQFTGPTAKKYGLTNPDDPMASADAAARLLRDNYANTKDWNKAIAAYNTGLGNINSQAGGRYLANVNRYRSMFSGLGGSGGAPSEAGVAGGGPDAPGTTAPAVLQNFLRDRRSGGTPTTAGETTETGVPPGSAAAGAVSDTDVSVANQSTPTDTSFSDQPSPELIDQYAAARKKAGLPDLPRHELAAEIRRLSRTPISTAQTFVSPAQAATAASGGSNLPSRVPSPAVGAAAASGGPLPSRLPSPAAGAAAASGGPLPSRVPSPAQGAAAASGGPNLPSRPGSGHPETDPNHPAHGAPALRTALKGDPKDPPPGPPLNENGYFPYHSVWGKGFTLPQLIYNIKKANPGINPAVLAGAIGLAQPMLNSAATENYRDQQDTMREQLESMREEASLQREREHEAAATDRTDITADTRLKIASSLDAYRKAQLDFGREKFDERIREFAIKDDEAQRSLFDREENARKNIELKQRELARITDRDVRSARINELRIKLQERRDLNKTMHDAVLNKIRMATSLNQPDQATQDALTKDEDARAAKAQKEITDVENKIKALENAGGNGGGAGAAVPAESLF